MKKAKLNEALFTGKRPLLIAHRGFTPVAPENSLVSFEAAAKRKYWAVETDVHATADGVLVCCHDSSLLRTYDVDLIIEEHTYEELKKYPLKKGNNISSYTNEELRMPLFEEYLTICQKYGCVPFIETKGKVVPQVLEMVEKMELTRHAVLSSTHFDHVVEARELSDIFVHYIFSSYEQMLQIAEMGNGGLSDNYPVLDDVPEGLIEKTHEAGVKVCLRAGDSEESLARMIAMGLDYIPTNCTLPR